MTLNGLDHLRVPSNEWIIFAVGACISCGLCVPIMLYWSCKTYKFRHQSFVRSYHPKILFFNCGLACVCVIERVITLSHDLGIFEYNRIIRNVAYIFIFGLYVQFYLLRHWLFFYDLGYREAQVNIRWEHELNLVRSHWWIDHRRNLGNARFMICCLLILFPVAFVILFAFYRFYGEFVWRIAISICGVSFSAIFLLISYKITTMNHAKMKQEVFYAGIWLLFGSIAYSIIINMVHFGQTTIIIVAWFVSTLLPFVLHLMSTWYQVRSNTAGRRKRSVFQQRQLDKLSNLPKKKLSLREILKNVDGFKLFIRHLIKDLCVENLIFLSYVIQFKILYSYIVQKELDNIKTRAALVEGDEFEASEFEESAIELARAETAPETERTLNRRQVVRLQTYSHNSPSFGSEDYIFDDDDEYNDLYGWSMELPQVFGLADKDKIKAMDALAIAQQEELTCRMYQEALNIYIRFIKVASKDEINISHKMRISLKKFFENEEVASYPQQNGIINAFAMRTRGSTSNNASNSRNGSLSMHAIAGSFPNSLPASLPAAAKGSYSNESMNIHLTQESTLDANESIEIDNSDAMISSEISDVIGDFGQFNNNNNSNDNEHISQIVNEIQHKPRTGTIGSEIGDIIKQRFHPRKASKLRSVLAQQPTDKFLNLTWIQRFRIFDKACDSIEKLLRIDSYGKFRESPEYLMYCEIMSKKKISTSSIMGRTSNIITNAIEHARGRSGDLKKAMELDLNSSDLR